MDLQSDPVNGYCYILHFQDHLTKFSMLAPLKDKSAITVAKVLRNFLTTLGAPLLLQSDNGREFVNKIIKNLSEIYPNTKLINGSPRKPRSQGSVESANKEVKNILRCWLKDHPGFSWVEALDIVKEIKNNNFHS